MTTKNLLPIFPVLFLSICGSGIASPEDDLAKIVKERETVLKKMESIVEARVAAGNASPDELLEARLRVNRFKRDASAVITEKIEFQKSVIQMEEVRFKHSELKFRKALLTEIEVLEANDRLLKERQILLKLQLEQKRIKKSE